MKKVFVLLADGFEEVEALMPVDALRRAGVETYTVSITDDLYVTGTNKITVKSDILLKEVPTNEGELLLLPGGMPGTTNLLESDEVKNLITSFHQRGKWLAAICAGPMILGEMGLVDGKKATCFPGFEKHLKGAEIVNSPAVSDGNIITARGVGAAIDFSVEIVRCLLGDETADKLAKRMMVKEYL